MKYLYRALLPCSILLSFSSGAIAETLQFRFSAVIFQVFDGESALNPEIDSGTQVTGLFSYTTAPTNSWDGDSGTWYEWANSPGNEMTDLRFSILGDTVSQAEDTVAQMMVANDRPPLGDAMQFYSFFGGGPSTGIFDFTEYLNTHSNADLHYWGIIDLNASNFTALDSEEIPLTLDKSDYDFPGGQLVVYDGEETNPLAVLRFGMLSIEAVPEPSAFLALLGGAAILARRRRNKGR